MYEKICEHCNVTFEAENVAQFKARKYCYACSPKGDLKAQHSLSAYGMTTAERDDYLAAKMPGKCEYKECTGLGNRKGLCGKHYDLARKGRDMNNERECFHCGGVLSTLRNGKHKYCEDCVPIRDRRALALLETYGISRFEFEAMYFEQDGQCAMPSCAKEATSVDHWHGCTEGHDPRKGCPKCIRALMCVGCNAKLAWVEDTLFVGACNEYLKDFSPVGVSHG